MDSNAAIVILVIIIVLAWRRTVTAFKQEDDSQDSLATTGTKCVAGGIASATVAIPVAAILIYILSMI